MNHTAAIAPQQRARHVVTGQGEARAFALRAPGLAMQASGVRHQLPSGRANTLDERVRAFFASGVGGPGVLVGALPFDTTRDVLCVQPQQVVWGNESPTASATLGVAPLRVVGQPDAATYAMMVERALDRIDRGDGGLRKVVLARSLHVSTRAPVDPSAIVERLSRDPSVTAFLVDLSLASGVTDHTMVGATPELLVSRRGSRIASHPLAGSAPRAPGSAEDQRIADALLRSEKDRREHAVVVEAILDVLSPLCRELSAPAGVGLRSTATMWHLGTRIEGVLKSEDGPSAAGLAALLHPTPAVGGDPRDAALEAIRALEPHDRGFYAGTIGFTEANGDGEWYVALRCAEIRGARVTLHAGAGIVAGSDPAKEVAETSAKFRAMLHALGIDERGEVAGGVGIRL